MNFTVMNFNRIRDLVSNLGWTEDQIHNPTSNCSGAIEKLEDELLNEDVVTRNVRISLHMCGTVKKDLIPILSYGKDAKMVATVTRILVNLSLPIEYILPLEEAPLTPKQQNVRKQLSACTLAIKKSFLNVQATLSLVTILREMMNKSEKLNVPLKEDDCNHLKNCLFLLRNVLHLPENDGILIKNSLQTCCEWQSVQSKLIWNLFVQGIDGALLLMLSSKYRTYWTVPMALIIAMLYRNQNTGRLYQAMELISSASESSEDDEESDGSKHSSTSVSSEPSKIMDVFSDSGCPLTSEASFLLKGKKSNLRQNKCGSLQIESSTSDIHMKLEKVQIADDCKNNFPKKQVTMSKANRDSKMKPVSIQEDDSESSSSGESPYHKKIKGNFIPSDVTLNKIYNCDYKSDSAVSMGNSSSEIINQRSSDDDIFDDQKPVKNLKAVQKLRCMQMHLKMSESDSSNEEMQDKNVKYRSHPPTGRHGKSPRKNNGCTPSICMNSAYETSYSKGRIRYPLWKKRNSVSALVDISSPTPSDDDIGNLLKEFTLSFMHSGFSQLVSDLKNVLLEGPSLAIDKSLFYWIVSYFLQLATTANICLDHISNILSVDVISFLVFECINTSENMEVYSKHNEKVLQYTKVHLNLVVIALKEVISAVDLYSRKCTSLKDRAFFNELCGNLAGLQDLRHAPLLLFRVSPQINTKQFLEDVIILNHQILIQIGRGLDHCCGPNKINFMSHLRMFSMIDMVYCFGKILEDFKTNSNILNDAVFTMMHHLAGDMHSSELLIEPSILKIFSKMLNEDMELEQYQEDLIIYILNKFSLKVHKNSLKEEKTGGPVHSDLSDDSSSHSCVSSNCLASEDDDDLFWWYLQFEQDKDPISRISEHFPTSKKDILSNLHLKGYISLDKYKLLEERTVKAQDKSIEVVSKEDHNSITNFDDDITHLLRNLVQAGQRQHLIWLQDVLMEMCYVKLGLTSHRVEPIPFYYVKMMLSVPLVPFTNEQKMILQDKIFLQLLEKLGLHLGTKACQMYPRIPLFWNYDILFTIASRLGPIKKDKLKFSKDKLMQSNLDRDSEINKNNECPILPSLSSCCTLSSWLTAVRQSKEIYRAKAVFPYS